MLENRKQTCGEMAVSWLLSRDHFAPGKKKHIQVMTSTFPCQKQSFCRTPPRDDVFTNALLAASVFC